MRPEDALREVGMPQEWEGAAGTGKAEDTEDEGDDDGTYEVDE